MTQDSPQDEIDQLREDVKAAPSAPKDAEDALDELTDRVADLEKRMRTLEGGDT
jgi:cell division protein FtsB